MKEYIKSEETTINDLIRIAKSREIESRKYPLVEGVGPQGVGKSTLSERLAEDLDGTYIEEDFEGLQEKLGRLNELKKKILLGEETEGMKKATDKERERAADLAFELEKEFLIRKVRQKPRVEEALKTGPVFWDASIWTDLIYAMTYRQLGIMREADYQSYLSIFSAALSELPASDLILGLQVSGKVLAERAENRWKENKERQFERTVPDEFYQAMANQGMLLIDKLDQADLPVEIIDTDKLDFTKTGLDGKHTVEKIQGTLIGLGFMGDIEKDVDYIP
ncbi:deoxynucleoside kinase [Candidatus Microgenomates bacterium]|nr:deoxynucleoside kinase [Candidatus Microgenomates bacterium]